MLLPAGVMDETERDFHLVHDTGRQQHRWTISEAVNTVKSPDNGRKHRSKHVELIGHK